MPKGLSENDVDEDETELLASQTMIEGQVALPEVQSNDVLFAAVAFPAMAIIMAYFCYNKRK